jgi:hypothetical protein
VSFNKDTSRRKRRCRNHLGSAGTHLAGRELQIRIDDEEIQWIAYYAKEMTSLVDRLLPDPRPQGKHERQTMRVMPGRVRQRWE